MSARKPLSSYAPKLPTGRSLLAFAAANGIEDVETLEDIAIKCHADPNIRVSFQSTIDRLSAKPRR